jgi:DNA-binding Xre family transcriptional regulator
MESKIEILATQQGMENVQQFAIEAGLPWSMAKAIWAGNIENRALKTLVKAARALNCKLEDLFEVQ